MEIDSGIYDGKNDLVAISEIVSHIDYRLMNDSRMMNVLKAKMSQHKLLDSTPIKPDEFFSIVNSVPESNLDLISACISFLPPCDHPEQVLISLTNNRLEGPTSIKTETEYDLSFPDVTLNLLFEHLLLGKRTTFEFFAKEGRKNTHFTGQKPSILVSLSKAVDLFVQGKLVDAYPLFVKAAEERQKRAFYYLSTYYQNGYGDVIQDEVKAANYANEGMSMGDPICALIHGMYSFKIATPEFREWLSQHRKPVMKLVKENDLDAMYEYANALLYSDPQNTDTASDGIEMLKRAANLGDWRSAYQFQEISQLLPFIGEDFPDLSSTFENVEWVDIQNTLGLQYALLVNGDMKSYNLAAERFLRSLPLQEKSNLAAGFMAYLLNAGLINDSLSTGLSKGSIPMYHTAALNCTEPLGLLYLGILYYSGIGKEQLGVDNKKAYECVLASYKLKKTGYAALLLGEQRLSGDGVKQDYELAFQYLADSVAMGEKRGLASLATCYEKGYGTKKSKKKAEELYTKAEEAPIFLPSFFELLSLYSSDLANLLGKAKD